MTTDQFARSELLLGKEALKRLKNSRVAIFGVGGVGGFCAEALVRAGVGSLDLIDSDKVSVTNLNRQIVALHSTLGLSKVEVMRARALDINPNVEVTAHDCFYLPETAAQFDFTKFDYVVDAVDTVTAKISIIMECRASGVPVISAMGAGNKLDPSRFEVADIYQTSVCPLARIMRKAMRERGVKHLKVVYSKEEPSAPRAAAETSAQGKRSVPGSLPFVPSVMGMILAGEVVRDLLEAK